jgi:menaquinone-dependent protoporphyrinogen oxidase
MYDVPVFYATTEGQTRRIAERLAADLRATGLSSAAMDMTSPELDQVDWSAVRAVLVGASIHGSTHQKEAGDFIARYAPRLNAVPSAFFSVSMSAASADVRTAAAAENLARDFVRKRHWRPDRVDCVAGRLAFTEYGWLRRRIMRMISKTMGLSADTSRDYEFTDWMQVDEIAADVAARAAPQRACALAG